jgi:hypothetical protein
MISISKLVATAALGTAFVVAPLSSVAAPTETTRAGATTVTLAPEFLGALSSLKVAPSAIAPGRLVVNAKGALATFRITTGAVDTGALVAEISHEGGLALTAGNTRVELSSFVIDLDGKENILTGLAVVNDSLAGRIPLFNLDLGGAKVGGNGNILKVDDVAVTLNEVAAATLNAIFGVTAFTENFPIGTADVRAILDNRH